MTAVNLFAAGPRGLLFTDTAAYDEDGLVHSFVSKSMAIPRLRMVIATRGMMRMLPTMAAGIDRMADSFDHFIEEGAGFIEQLFGELEQDDEAMESDFELTALGWSEARNACLGVQLASIDIPGRNAFAWSTGAVMIAPNPPMEDLVAAGVLVNGIFDERRIEESLLKVMEIQRSYRVTVGTDPTLPERHTVGGQVIATEITEHGITQRILRTWPDRVGEHIEPRPAENVLPLSREQRRRLEKMNRKAARTN